jgi:anti-sigma factor RsiW
VTCRQFADFIADYLSGELPAPTLEQFEHHLTICQNCLTYVANYRQTIALGRRVFTEDDAALPGDVPEDLVSAILSLRAK